VTQLNLNRMEIEEAGLSPVRLAEAIHAQLGPRSGGVEVHAIAKALDIIEIREEPLKGFEAALVTLPDRGFGSIVVNLSSKRQRRRFSVGHELLHFLNPWHAGYSATGFHCSRKDMLESNKLAHDRHRRQEAEANEFAIELLAPSARVAPYIDRAADLRHAIAMADDLDISREASARRYVARHEDRLAVVFVKDGLVRYFEAGAEFPNLSIWKGQPTPSLPAQSRGGLLSEFEEIDSTDWLRRPKDLDLSAQVLRQRDDYAIVLLKARSSDAEDDGLEDTFDRFTRAGTRR